MIPDRRALLDEVVGAGSETEAGGLSRSGGGEGEQAEVSQDTTVSA